MKNILEKRISGKPLELKEATAALEKIITIDCDEIQATAFITTYCMNPPTTNELKGFRNALLEKQLKIDFSSLNTVDVCGTGGDEKNTFNISTIVAFVVAATGEKVVKHGNYSISSNCGSSNVLEFLGYNFQTNKKKLKESLEKYNFCYFHAPLFNPAMKNVAQIRNRLGLKTFFNLLGPLLNPSSPKNQLIGVSDLKTLSLYKQILSKENINFALIHSLDGYDEVSLTSNVKYITSETNTELSTISFNLSPVPTSSLYGGKNIKEAADIFIKILKGDGSCNQNNVVSANTALALKLLHPNDNLPNLTQKAKDILRSEKAYFLLKKLLDND